MKDWLNTVLGGEMGVTHLTLSQVLGRAVIIFFAALCIVRVADKRFLSKKTAFDVILGFILASMLGRAIVGSEPVLPTITAGFALALLHRLLGRLACRWPTLGGVLKGHSQTIIKDGEVDHARLYKHDLSEEDLEQELRLNGVESAEEVKLARLERSGEISVVKKQ